MALSKRKPLMVALEGIIASGKTTLMSQLQRHSDLKIKVIPEPIASWKDVREFDFSQYAKLSALRQQRESWSEQASGPIPNLSQLDLSGLKNGTNNTRNQPKHHMANSNNDTSIDASQFELLSQMYCDPKRWSYSFQIWALFTRAISIESELLQMAENNEHADVIVLERSAHANKIFATVMREYERMNECEWVMYEMIFNYITSHMPKLNGVIYLDCQVDKAMKRLANRNRNGEENVDAGYQMSLHNAHNEWFDQLHDRINQNNGSNLGLNGKNGMNAGNGLNGVNGVHSSTKMNWNEFESNMDVLKWPAKDFLENNNDLMDFAGALHSFIDKQRKQMEVSGS